MLCLLPYAAVTSFSPTQNSRIVSFPASQQNLVRTTLQMAPGGWGIGNPLDFKDEEFSSSSSSSKRRRRRRRKDGTGGIANEDTDEVAYSAETAEKIADIFGMEDAQQFSQRIQQERNNLQLQKQKDLMEIAKMAGLGDRMKPKVNKNDGVGPNDTFGSFDLDDDDDLDVRVQWED